MASWLLDSDDPVASIPGVPAESSVAAAFADAWHRGGGAELALYREELIYSLTELRPPSAPPGGGPRRTPPADRALLVDWFSAFAVATNTPPGVAPWSRGQALHAGTRRVGRAGPR